MRYRIGRTVFDVLGDGAVADLLRDEFSPALCPDAEAFPRLVITFCDQLPRIGGNVIASAFEAGRDHLYHSCQRFEFLHTREGELRRLFIRVKPKKRAKRWIPDRLARLKEMSNLGYDDQVAKDILYDCFDHVFQHAQLEDGQSFIHASSILHRDKAVAFIAWGGVGKTTALLKLIHGEGCRFLSDDLGILDRSGDLHHNPKKLQIYAYNMQGEPWLRKAVLEGRAWHDKLAWHYRERTKGVKRVRRRVSPTKFFGEAANAARGTLGHAVYLERTDAEAFSATPASVEAIAARAAHILIEELSPFSKVSSFYNSAFPDGGLVLSHGELYRISKEIIASGLQRADGLTLLQLPRSATPEDLYAYLKQHVLTE